LSQMEFGTQSAHARPEPLRLMVEGFWDIQEVRKKLGNALKAYKRMGIEDMYLEEVKLLIEDLKEIENSAKEKFSRRIELHPLTDWACRIKGVDQIYIAQLISVVGDINRFSTVSKFWKYMGWGVELRCKKCGRRLFKTEEEKNKFVEKMIRRLREAAERRKYKKGEFSEERTRERVLKWCCKCKNPQPVHVAQRRRRGELSEFNRNGKKVMGRIAISIIRVGKLLEKKGKTPPRYYQYMMHKLEVYRKRPGLANQPLKVYRRAQRVMIKLFLAHVWEVWRQKIGLPTKAPYGTQKLGEEYISPWDMVDTTD